MSSLEIGKKNPRRKILIFLSITGLTGVFALVLFFFLNQWIWRPFVDYNFYLIIIQITQMLLTGLLILFFTGAWAVSQCRLSINNQKDALVIGLLSGCITGTGIAFCIALTRNLPEGSVYFPVLCLIILSIILASLGTMTGAVGYYHRLSFGEASRVAKKRGAQCAFTLTALFILILLSASIPPMLALIGTTSGLIANDCLECRLHQEIRVERLDNLTIRILYSAKMPAVSWIGRYNPPRILIHDIDVSNQTVSEKNGFPVTVNPAGGLTYDEDSVVIISGKGVANCNSTPIRLKVISYNGSEQPVILYDDSI
ncbi:hypothetical protein [Methanoregula formicica]|uniref:Uncharacterized protein n=1 Tax=Methanoregula formicica (strain DSM 22288 / NBRC 105244 / SMSP) TaxID=593750 RepID=L0HBM5_METFS|nr:hypothetical protein [Methanoregula formicica]AGB01191.1 hypothetical protein Metfor_0105 [Methanoregula formicica SMSP]